MALPPGSMRRKSAGRALIAAPRFHGMHRRATGAAAALRPKRSGCPAGGDSCAVSRLLRRTGKQKRKEMIIQSAINKNRLSCRT